MPKTYYDSELTAEQIEDALTAIDGVVNPGNNGKVLYVENGQIKAASASRWSGSAVLEPLSVTANGDYYPPSGTDGFDEVHVAVPSATLTTKNITSNGTYNALSDNADGYSSVTVAVPGGATIEPLEVTQNGTYNPPSGVDGYAPVTVNVSGSGGNITDYVTWEQGGVNMRSGDRYSQCKASSQTRIRTLTTFPLIVGNTYEVTVDSLFKVAVYCFNANENAVTDQSYAGIWQDTFQFTAAYPYMALMLKKSDDANIYPSDAANSGIAVNDLTS